MEISNVSDPSEVSFHLYEICGKVIGIYTITTSPHMHTIIKTPMSYKSYCKKGDTILARIQVIQHRIYYKKPIIDITESHTLHRNSVRNIMSLYQSLAPPEFKMKIENGEQFSQDEMNPLHPMCLCTFLIPLSRKPKSHPKQASREEESKILIDFQKAKV